MNKKIFLKKAGNILIHPITGTFLSFFAVIAGGLLSLYSKEIKASFPFQCSSFVMSNLSILLWAIVLIFLVLTPYRQYIKEKRRSYQTTNLISSIQSLPPHDFAFKFREEYESLSKILKDLKILANNPDNIGEEELLTTYEEAVRIVLDTYVTLAQIWDMPESIIEPDTTYRANIMIYKKVHEIPDEAKDWIESQCRNFFVEKNIDSALQSIDALLILEDNTFTTTTESRKPNKDESISPLCLSVTLPNSSKKRIQNIPGAPKAVVDQKVQWILDTNDIYTTCTENEHFDKHTLNRIKEYYENSNAKSIISMPLLNENEIIGAINIYRNKKQILKNEILAEQFSAFISPFNVILKEMITEYSNIKKNLKN